MKFGPSIPPVYLASVAIIGAALADFVVESTSNTGIFGTAFVGNDLSSVTPTLILGLVLTLAIAGRSLRRKNSEGDWLANLAKRVATNFSVTDLAWTFAAQIFTLYAIESCEQYLNFGHVLGGAEWFGGPILVSLAVHAFICVVAMLSLVHLCRALRATLESIVATITALILALAPSNAPPSFGSRRPVSYRRLQEPLVRRTRGRAPPRSVLVPALIS